MRGASCASCDLALTSDARQKQRVEPGIQSWAVGWVRVQHGVVPWVDVGVGARVRVVDFMGVAAWALGAQTVGPGVGECGCRRDAGLRDHVSGPQGAVRVAEGDGAGGELWMDRDGHGGEAGVGLGRKDATPR